MDEIVKNFHENGIGLVKGFASKDECKVMIEKMKEIINNTNMKERVYIAFISRSVDGALSLSGISS